MFTCTCGLLVAHCPALVRDGIIIAQAFSCQKGYTVSLEEAIFMFMAGAALGWCVVGLFFWGLDALKRYYDHS